MRSASSRSRCRHAGTALRSITTTSTRRSTSSTAQLTFQVGEELATAGPGSLTFAPRGSHHTLANLGDSPARYLLICTPGGFERMFIRLEARKAGAEPPAEALEPFPPTIVVGPTIPERLDGAA